MDTGISYHRVAGFNGRDELGVVLGFLLLRTNEEEVEDDENENQRHHLHEDVRLL